VETIPAMPHWCHHLPML